MRESLEKFEISTVVKQQIDHWLTKYPPDQKQSALIAALLLVQGQNGGYLSQAAMQEVAAYLDLPDITVYEVATFYDLYNLKPIGKHKISICTNIACMLRGSAAVVQCVEEKLGIKMGETTADYQFTLKEVECMAACAGAPMCQINDKHYYENLTPEKMLDLIDRLASAPNTGNL